MAPWPPPTHSKVWCYAVGTGLSIALFLVIAVHIAGRSLGMIALFPPTWIVVNGSLGSFLLWSARQAGKRS